MSGKFFSNFRGEMASFPGTERGWGLRFSVSEEGHLGEVQMGMGDLRGLK